MIEVDERISAKRIDTLVSELKYVNSNTFLAGLALRQKADQALSFLKSIFPHSLGNSKSDLNEFGMHLRSGFVASYSNSGSKIAFSISHALEGESRAETVLRSLDTGSRAFKWIADRTLHFLGDAKTLGRKNPGKSRLLWVTIGAGQEVDKSARLGVEYTSRTEEYIRDVIFPELQVDFDEKVANRMKRIEV